jgi:hypothetical protein
MNWQTGNTRSAFGTANSETGNTRSAFGTANSDFGFADKQQHSVFNKPDQAVHSAFAIANKPDQAVHSAFAIANKPDQAMPQLIPAHSFDIKKTVEDVQYETDYEKIKKFIDVTDKSYIKRFIELNKIIKGSRLKEIDTYLFPGHRIHYIILKKGDIGMEELIAFKDSISLHSGYTTVFDFLPTNVSDSLPGLVKILDKIHEDVLYDIVFEFDSSFPNCSKCVVDYIISRKLKQSSV